MFDASSSRVRRLLRAAMPVTPPPHLRSDSRRRPASGRASSFLRRSPLLLLAALAALAVFFVHAAHSPPMPKTSPSGPPR